MITVASGVGRIVAVVVAAVLSGAVGTGAAFASAPREVQLPHATQDDGVVKASVSGQFPASAGLGTRVSVLVNVSAPLTELKDVSASLSVTDAPLASAEDIASFVEDPDTVLSHPVAQSPVTAAQGSTSGPPGSLPVGTSSTVALSADPGTLGLPDDAWGVYGLAVTVTVGGQEVWSQAAPLTWQPRLVPPIAVTVVASVSGSNERVTSLLTAASDDRVTLMVDPSALTTSQRMTLDTREAYLLPAGNLDVTSVAHAEAPALLDAALEESRRYLSLPWLGVAASADDATASLATQAGAVATLADPRWAAVRNPPAPVVTPEPPADVELSPMVLPDRVLSATLATQPPDAPATTAWLLAVAALHAGSGHDSAIIAPGDGWVVDGSRPSLAIQTLLDAPFVTARPLTAALSVPDRPVLDLPESSPSPSDIGSGQAIVVISSLGRIAALETVTDRPSSMLMEARRGLFSAMSLANRANPERRAGELAAAIEQAQLVVDALGVTSGTSLNLVSSSGDVPITVRNELDVPVTVQVAMISRSPALVPKAQPGITVEPGSEATALVPVTAVSNDDVNVTVALRNDEGQTVSVAQTLRVKVRAQWGNAATGIFTAALALLLIAGIARTARRGRKDTRIRPGQATPVAGASAADE